MDLPPQFEIKTRTRSQTEPIVQSLTKTSSECYKQLSKSKSFSYDRAVFGGCITAGAVIICNQDDLSTVCDNYNKYDRHELAKDCPSKICGLSYDLVKKFPKEIETNPNLKPLVTDEMKAEANKHSNRWRYGHDFIFDHCIKQETFDQKIADNLHLMCQIVIPNRRWAFKYPNIDLTNITGKTSKKLGDRNILETLARETEEELGLRINEYLPNGKSGILHPNYQYRMRKHYKMMNLPYDFKIAGHGDASTQVFVLVVDKNDLIEAQVFKQNLDKNGDCDNYCYDNWRNDGIDYFAEQIKNIKQSEINEYYDNRSWWL